MTNYPNMKKVSFIEGEKERQFTGFSPETLTFLLRVHEENSRAWFEHNRDTYRTCLLEPLQCLVSDVSETMHTIDPYFETRPLVNKTISRIYRDTRFSRDKSLFKNTMWIVFKRPIKNWKDAPGYFFEISPDVYRYGMGYYSASRSTMDQLRDSIDEDPAAFQRAISFYSKQDRFLLEGEKYKRQLDNDHQRSIQDWYQRKSFYLVCNRDIDHVLFSAGLVDELIQGYLMLKPLYQYLANIQVFSSGST